MINSKLLATLVLFFIASLTWAIPTPKYLSVPSWKECTKTIVKGSATFVCLPANKPDSCPKASWKVLNEEQLIEPCE